MTKPWIEIEMTFDELDIIEQAVTIDPTVDTVEEFIEKYSLLAAQEVLLQEKSNVKGE